MTVLPTGVEPHSSLSPGFDGISSDTTTFNFAIYVISPGEFFLLSMDAGLTANPVFSGQALQRSLASSSAFQPGLAVFSWSGSSVVPAGSAPGTLGTPQAAIGQLSIFDTTGDLTGLQYDINNGGVVTGGQDSLGLCSTKNKKGKVVPNTPPNCVYSIQSNNDILVSVAPVTPLPNPAQYSASCPHQRILGSCSEWVHLSRLAKWNRRP